MPHITLNSDEPGIRGFCMFNRYVDGLATIAPSDPDLYNSRARRIAADGYLALMADSQRQDA